MSRVIHIIDNAGVGGASSIFESIYENRENNWYFFVLRKTEKKRKNIRSNYYIADKHSKYNPLLEIATLYFLIKILRRHKIEIIHAHLQKSIYTSIVLKFFFPTIKVVVHEHGLAHRRNFLYWIVIQLAKPLLAKFIAPSKTTKEILEEKFKIPSKKVEVVYNPLIPFSIPHKKLNRSEQGKKIGFIGRLNYVKGADILLEAFSKLGESSATLEFIGDGPEREKIEMRAKKYGIDKKVKFHGNLSREELYKIATEFSLIVCPSRSESFGLVAIESQSLGIPLITSDIDSFNEILMPNSFVSFKQGDPNDLANRINQVFSNLEQRQMLINNGKENIKKYSLESFLERIKNIYKKI